MNTPCTLLAEPIRVRLYENDLKWLREIYHDDLSMFIRSVVHARIKEIKNG